MSEATPTYRVELRSEDLLRYGFDPREPSKGWPVMKGMMEAMGVPSWCLEDRTPVRITSSDTSILLEFDH